MRKPKIVIFDMDGLMFDTETIGSKHHRQAAKEFGYTIPLEISMSLIGGNMKRNRKILIEALGQDCPLDDISKRSKELRDEHFKEYGLGIKKGLVELIDYLKEKDIKIAIASSSSREVIESYLEMSQLLDKYDYIISGDKVEKSKPEPDIFLHVCKHFNVQPEEALVLEDSKNGILAAHAGNIPVICVPDMIFHDKEIFKLTYATVPSLLDVIDCIEKIDINLAIFDMDGLMFDTENMCIEPLIKANDEFGYTITREICHKLIGTSGKIAQEIMCHEFGKDYPFDKVFKRLDELMFEEIDTNGLPMKNGLIEFLEHLKKQKIPCVIASSSSSKIIAHYLDVSNTSKYFDDIVGGDHVKVSKPEPDIFIEACARFDMDVNHAMVFEDSKNGIIAANRAGIKAVCVPDLLMHNQEVLNQTKMFVPSLDILVEIIK